MTTERKEIIQINGLTILVTMVLIANFLIAGFFYRYNGHQLFLENKRHNIEYSGLLKQEHDLHEEIVKREGAKNWQETNYVRSIQLDK
jgi:hypothetical protein